MKGKKIKYLNLFIILLLCFSIGYAVLNTTLIINGTSNISKNTWDVHFENIQITEGSVEPIIEPVIEDKNLINFELTLDKPGDYYEFTVDVVNRGTIDAMIDSISKTPDLSEEQKKYINYVVEYQNEEDVNSKHLVQINSFVKLLVRVEYKKDLVSSDLPSETESLILGFNINYVQADEAGSVVTNNGVKPVQLRMVSGDFYTPGSEFCLGSECFYVMGVDDGLVGVIPKYNLYVGNKLYLDENGDPVFETLNNPTGIQNELAKGALSGPNEEPIYPFIGGYAYEDGEFSGYENSDIKKVVDYYANYISSLGYVPFDYGLISIENLIYLGCDFGNATCTNTGLDFLYSTTYWLYNCDSYDAAVMGVDGKIVTIDSSLDFAVGVRPGFIFNIDELTK